MTLADRLRKIRIDANLRQAEFGALVGLGQKTVSEYESGRSAPGVARLLVIADKFGINPDWLIKGDGEPEFKSQTIDAETRAQIEREHINRLFSELTPATQKIILEVLRDKVAAIQKEKPSASVEVSNTSGGVINIQQEIEIK